MHLRHMFHALVPAALLALLAGGALAEPVLRWEPSDTTVLLGDELTLSVMLDDTLDVRTIELYVQYDPAVVATVDGEPGALFDGFNLFQGFEAESADTWHGYAVILGAGDWTSGPGELFRWTVAGLAEGTSPIVTVAVTLLPPGGGDYTEVVLTDDQITVLDPTAAADETPQLPQVALYPNPFNPRTRVELTLPGGGSGRLEVVDVRGRVVAAPWSGVLADGILAMDWNARDRSGAPLPSGVYTFRLLTGDGRAASARGVLVR